MYLVANEGSRWREKHIYAHHFCRPPQAGRARHRPRFSRKEGEKPPPPRRPTIGERPPRRPSSLGFHPAFEARPTHSPPPFGVICPWRANEHQAAVPSQQGAARRTWVTDFAALASHLTGVGWSALQADAGSGPAGREVGANTPRSIGGGAGSRQRWGRGLGPKVGEGEGLLTGAIHGRISDGVGRASSQAGAWQ